MSEAESVLVLACGALGREIQALKKLNGWKSLEVRTLPAHWHNTPELIPEGIRELLEWAKSRYGKIYTAYADCGTGGKLDGLLREFGVERLPGAHCYEFYSGAAEFSEMAEEEPGTFYLTDFLVKNFDRLVIHELGLDRHPELREEYFRNYRRLVYLSQTENRDLQELASKAAQRLGLEYHYRFTGYGELESSLQKWMN